VPPGAETTAWLAVAGLAVGVLGLLVALGSQARLTRVRRALRVLRGTAEDADVLAVTSRQAAELRTLRGRVDVLGAQLDRTRRDVASSLRHVAVVRYDAFGDVGGRLSFSAALVDDDGDGLVVTSIAGRAESRAYAKGLAGGRSELPLSEEETQAVRAAGGHTSGGRTSGARTPGARTPGGQAPGGQAPGEQATGGRTSEGQAPEGQAPEGQTSARAGVRREGRT